MKNRNQLFVFYLLCLVAGLMACTNYGKKVNHGHIEVYYKDGISKEQAQKTADLLYLADVSTNNNTTTRRSMQLLKKNEDTICFRMAVDELKLASMGNDPFYAIGSILSDSIFNGKPVSVELTTNRFITIRSLAFKKMQVNNYGELVTSGKIEVYCKDGFSTDQGALLANFLDRSLHPGNEISFQVSKNTEGTFQLLMVSTPEKAATVADNDFYDLARSVSDSVFYGAPVTFQLTDQTFIPFKKIVYPAERPATDTLPPGN